MRARKSARLPAPTCGFGLRTDWFRNIDTAPDVEIDIGRQHFAACCRVLPEDEAASVIKAYEQRNWFIAPIVRAVLRRLLGWCYNGSDEDRCHLAAQLPIVAFRPRGVASR